jgi:hypothetical protein
MTNSMGQVAGAYDNASIESFWGSMPIELLDHPDGAGPGDVRVERSAPQPRPPPLKTRLPIPVEADRLHTAVPAGS